MADDKPGKPIEDDSATTTSNTIRRSSRRSARRGSTCWRRARGRSRTGTSTATTSTSSTPSSSVSRSTDATKSFRCSGRTARSSSRASTRSRQSRSWCQSSRTGGRCIRPPPRCWSAAPRWRSTSRTSTDLMKLIRDDVALIGRGVAWCRYESARARSVLRLREGLHRLQGPPRLPAQHLAQLVRGDVGRGGELPDARRGAQAVRQVQRRRVPGRRVQGEQGGQGGRRRGQPRARQVLGDLGQDRAPRGLGVARAARTSSTRTTRTSTCSTSSRVRSRPTARCSAARWSRSRT